MNALRPRSGRGQTRRFDVRPATSGLPLPAQPVDATQARLVRFVQILLQKSVEACGEP